MRRRCGWVPAAMETPERVVWAKGKCSTTSCPTSLITAQSLAWLEHYFAWRLSGGRDLARLEARTADAICVLENEVRSEGNHGGR